MCGMSIRMQVYVCLCARVHGTWTWAWTWVVRERECVLDPARAGRRCVHVYVRIDVHVHVNNHGPYHVHPHVYSRMSALESNGRRMGCTRVMHATRAVCVLCVLCFLCSLRRLCVLRFVCGLCGSCILRARGRMLSMLRIRGGRDSGTRAHAWSTSALPHFRSSSVDQEAACCAYSRAYISRYAHTCMAA